MARADDNLYLEADEVQLRADNYMLWDTNLVIRNTPKVTLFDANPDSSFSTRHRLERPIRHFAARFPSQA